MPTRARTHAHLSKLFPLGQELNDFPYYIFIARVCMHILSATAAELTGGEKNGKSITRSSGGTANRFGPMEFQSNARIEMSVAPHPSPAKGSVYDKFDSINISREVNTHTFVRISHAMHVAVGRLAGWLAGWPVVRS